MFISLQRKLQRTVAFHNYVKSTADTAYILTSCAGCELLYTTGGAECCGATLALGKTACSLPDTAAIDGYV